MPKCKHIKKYINLLFYPDPSFTYLYWNILKSGSMENSLLLLKCLSLSHNISNDVSLELNKNVLPLKSVERFYVIKE